MPLQVTPLPKEMPLKNLQLMRYLKMMYFLGYLPISWETSTDLYNNGNFFKNSTIKSCVMLIFDSLMGLSFITLYYVWHLLNMDKDFDLSLIWTPKYIIGVYNGVVTSALSQLFYCFFPSMVFWIYTFLGNEFNTFLITFLLSVLWIYFTNSYLKLFLMSNLIFMLH